MTKTTYITNLEEIKGLKVVCKNCGSGWFIPLNRSMIEEVENKCISCGKKYPGEKLFKFSLKINELLTDSTAKDFNFLIETDFEK